MAGIVLGRYLPSPPFPFYLLSIILLGVSFSLFLKGKTLPVNLFLFSLTLLIGYLYFSLTYFPSSPTHIINFAPSEAEVEIVGRVASRPQEKIFSKRKRVSFILKAETVEPTPSLAGVEKKDGSISSDAPHRKNIPYGKTEGRVWVNSYFPYLTFSYGDRVKVRGRLRIPRPAREKGDFDWQRYLSYQGIWVELHTGKVKMLESSRFSLVGWAQQNEDHLAARIEKTLPDPHAQVAKSILLGDKERLPPPILEDFRRTGTAQAVPVQLG